METTQDEVLQLFEQTGALLKGHFVLRSGLHSGHFFQCAQVCQDMAAVTRMAELTLEKVGHTDFQTVVAPAMGGLVIGQEIARQSGKRYIFLEKQDGDLALRRGFKLNPGEKVQEALKIIRDLGAEPVAVTVIVDRSNGNNDFGTPFHSLAALTFPTYQENQIPPELAAIPVTKPGS
jgi:orotate phosphoribosyltransferase